MANGKFSIKIEVKRDRFHEAGVIAECICDKMTGNSKPDQYYIDKIMKGTQYEVDGDKWKQ